MYPHELTGDPFLDGCIYGRGAPKNAAAVQINVSNCPTQVVQAICERGEQAGYEVDLLERYNANTRTEDLIVLLIGHESIFNSLPRYRDRRLVPGETPMEFTRGYVSVCTVVRDQAVVHHANELNAPMMRVVTYRGDAQVEDVLQCMAEFGLEQYDHIDDNGGIHLHREDWQGLEAFDHLYDCSQVDIQACQELSGNDNPLDAIIDNHFAGEHRDEEYLEAQVAIHGRLKELDRLTRMGKSSFKLQRLPEENLQDTTMQSVLDDLHLILPDLDLEALFRNENPLPVQQLRRAYENALQCCFNASRQRQDIERLFEMALQSDQYQPLLDIPEIHDEPAAKNLLVAMNHVANPLFQETGMLLHLKPTFTYENNHDRARELLTAALDSKGPDLYGLIGPFTPSSDAPDTRRLEACGSCGRQNVPTWDDTCRACNTVLCLSCTVEYALDDEFQNPFSRRPTVDRYCSDHHAEVVLVKRQVPK